MGYIERKVINIHKFTIQAKSREEAEQISDSIGIDVGEGLCNSDLVRLGHTLISYENYIAGSVTDEFIDE
mgnify:CR=1 FL=1